jgi:hypothetical protein
MSAWPLWARTFLAGFATERGARAGVLSAGSGIARVDVRIRSRCSTIAHSSRTCRRRAALAKPRVSMAQASVTRGPWEPVLWQYDLQTARSSLSPHCSFCRSPGCASSILLPLWNGQWGWWVLGELTATALSPRCHRSGHKARPIASAVWRACWRLPVVGLYGSNARRRRDSLRPLAHKKAVPEFSH